MNPNVVARRSDALALVAGTANAVDVAALYLLTVIGRVGAARWGVAEGALPILAMTSMAGTAVGGVLLAPLARRYQRGLVLASGAAAAVLCGLAAVVGKGPWIWPVGFALGVVSVGVVIGGFAVARTAVRAGRAIAVHSFTWLVVNSSICVAAVWIATRHGVGWAFVAFACAFVGSAVVMWRTLQRHPLPRDSRRYASICAATFAIARRADERVGVTLAAASGAAFGAFWAVAAIRLPLAEAGHMGTVSAMIVAGGVSVFGWQKLLRFPRALLVSAITLLLAAFVLPLIRAVLEHATPDLVPAAWIQITVENAALEIGAAAIVVWLGATFGPRTTGLETLAVSHAVKYGAMALAGIAAGAAAAWLPTVGGALVGLAAIAALLLTIARCARGSAHATRI